MHINCGNVPSSLMLLFVRRSAARTTSPIANAIEEIDLPTGRRPKLVRGGLAPWQVRRITTHIEANLDAPIRIKDLAALINLSPSHFSRAFKEGLADSPHRYLMHRRLERAQGMMLTTNASLGQIAGECGFADQAHFNKLFRRLVGESPRAWRRVRGSSHLISDRRTLDAPALERQNLLMRPKLMVSGRAGVSVSIKLESSA